MFAQTLPAFDFAGFALEASCKGKDNTGGDSDSGVSTTSGMGDGNDGDDGDMLARMSAFLDEFDEGGIHGDGDRGLATPDAAPQQAAHPAAAPRRASARARPAPLNLSGNGNGLSLGSVSSQAVASPFSTIRLAPDTPTTPLTPFSDIRVPAQAQAPQPSLAATAMAAAATPGTPGPATPGTPTASLLQPLSELFKNPECFAAADVTTLAWAILQAQASPASSDGSGMFFASPPPGTSSPAAKQTKKAKKHASGPRATYLQLCALALGEVGDNALVTSLYAWIEKSHPSLCTSKYWKNAVRHALSASRYFQHDGNIGNSRWSLDPAVRLDLANCPAGTTPRYLADKRKELRSLKSRKRRSADLTEAEFQFVLVPPVAPADDEADGPDDLEGARPGSPSQRRKVDETLDSLAGALTLPVLSSLTT